MLFWGETKVLPDGTLLYVMTVSSPDDGSRIQVSKMLPNGQMDNGFGTGGHALFSIGVGDYGFSLTIQPDGKVIIAGATSPSASLFQSDFLVFRLNPNGTLDKSFAENGLFIRDFVPAKSKEFSNDIAGSVRLLPDGKMIVAGYSDRYESLGRASSFATLVRLDPDGVIDTGFGSNGITQTHLGSNHTNGGYGFDRTDAFLKSDGKILIGITVERPDSDSPNSYTPHALIVRYNENGSLDNTFAGNGVLAVQPGKFSFLTDMEITLDDKMLVCIGYLIARYDSEGELDMSFGEKGYVGAPNSLWRLLDIYLTRDQKILVSASENIPLQPSGETQGGGILRLRQDGSRDLRFGRGGIVRADFGEIMIGFGSIGIYENAIFVSGGYGIPGGRFMVAKYFYGK